MCSIHSLRIRIFPLFFLTKKLYTWLDLQNFGLPSSTRPCLKSPDSKNFFQVCQYKKKISNLNSYQITLDISHFTNLTINNDKKHSGRHLLSLVLNLIISVCTVFSIPEIMNELNTLPCEKHF